MTVRDRVEQGVEVWGGAGMVVGMVWSWERRQSCNGAGMELDITKQR